MLYKYEYEIMGFSPWELKMDKKTGILILLLFFLSILYTGCLENNNNNTLNVNGRHMLGSPPVPIISPIKNKYYFGDSIQLDASESYDLDGEITSYIWDFGDGTTANGVTVEHVYSFENEFDIEYPLVYTISLSVIDDDGLLKTVTQQIKMYPLEYVFFLDYNALTVEKPYAENEWVKTSILSGLKQPSEILYSLEKPVELLECTWNATLYLEKTFFSMVTKVSIVFYNEKGDTISEESKKIGLNNLWTEKTIKISGLLNKEETLGSVKILVFGFNYKVKLFYGGDKASFIVFSFKN